MITPFVYGHAFCLRSRLLFMITPFVYDHAFCLCAHAGVRAYACMPACGHVDLENGQIFGAGVIIDKRRDHKRLAEERRRRRRCAAPQKNRGAAVGRACEPDRAPFFLGGRRGGVVVCVPTPIRRA